MLRSLSCFTLSLAVLAIAHGQMSRSAAEKFLANSNGGTHVSKETRIWGLMAEDAALVAALRNPTTDKACVAVWETSRRGSPALVSALIGALPKANKTVGVYIIGSLSKMSTQGTRSAVEKATSHRIPEVRWEAAVLSSKWGFNRAISSLVEAIKNDKAFALEALGRVGTRSHVPVVKAFYARALKRPYRGYGPVETEMAILAMASLRDSWAVGQLRKEVDRPSNKDFRQEAIQTLGKLKDANDVDRFVKSLNDSDVGVRLASVEALGISGSRRAIQPLRQYVGTPSKDLSSAALNEARGRKYAVYVADCIASGKSPMSQTEWNLKNPLYPVAG